MKIGRLPRGVGRIDTRIAHPPAKVKDPHYYTPQHLAWAAAVIARAGGRCEWVEDGDRCAKAQPAHRMFADHIVEIKDGGAKSDLANGRCLCGQHHTIKTTQERVKRNANPA